MTGDNAVSVLWGVLALVLVGSSLLARRLPLGQTIRMTLGWVAIFGAVYILFLFRDDAREIFNRARTDIMGDSGQVVGDAFRIRQAYDGHYWARGTLNGSDVRFLIDSGATTTTISRKTAAAAGIEPSGRRLVMVETANGTVAARPARVERLTIGSIEVRDAPVLISDVATDTDVLGMSFLSELKSWKVEDRALTLQP